MSPLGKKELLLWAAETSGVRPCNKYADLRDGVVFLILANRLFPGSVDLGTVQRHPPDVVRNWDTLRCVLDQHGLPLHLCDRHAVAAGHARHCFNMLVLFYFLTKLARDSDFCVDFANPIDTEMAAFLQSTQSLICLGKQSAAEMASQMTTTNESATVGPATTTTTPTTTVKRRTAFVLAPTVANEGTKTETGELRGAVPWGESQAEAPAPPKIVPVRATSAKGVYSHAMSSRSSSKVTEDEASHAGYDSAQINSLRAQNARLQEELDHVRATSQVMLAQQRALVTSELTRMTEQFETQMALARLERDHELRQCLLDVREEYNNFIVEMRGDAGSSSGPVRALESKLHILELELARAGETVEQLRRTITTQRDRYETFAQKIRSICASVPPAELDERSFVESITSLMEPYSQQQYQEIEKEQQEILRDTVVLRLKAMVSHIKTLHSETERLGRDAKNQSNDAEDTQGTHRLRLQLERLQLTNQFLRQRRRQQQQQQEEQDREYQQHGIQKDWYAVPLADGLEAPSSMIDSDTCDAICARALSVVKESHDAVNSPIPQEFQRLITVIQILQLRVETANSTLIAYRDKQQSLYEELLWAQQNNDNESRERQLRMEAKLDEQHLRMESKETAQSTKMRFVEEHCSRRESVANILHERVREMIGSLQQQQQKGSHHTDNGVALRVDMQKAMQKLLEDVAQSQRTHDSLEAALRDLSEEVAVLRRQIGQRERDGERLRAALTAATAQLQEEQRELTHARAEVHTLRDTVNIELDALRRCVRRVGDLLMMEKLPPLQTVLQPSNISRASSSCGGAAVPPLSSFTSSSSYRFQSDDRTVEVLKKEEQRENMRPRSSAATAGVTTAAFVGGTPSLLLSSEELERRKKAILSKYGFTENSMEH